MRLIDIDPIVERLKNAIYLGKRIDEDTANMEAVLADVEASDDAVIHCRDCKWWNDRGSGIGYCHAAKHGYWSEHWEISIHRTYKGDFFCADAERRSDG